MADNPPEPRPASSVLVVRHSGAGVAEVLMARRAAGHRFMPNMLVFPGGAVDPEDYDAPASTPLRPHVLARLERSASQPLAHALGIAAARELEEEVGLSLGAPPALAGLDYLCRAITPPDRSMRFDARFFIVDASLVTGTPTGSVEMEVPAWYAVADALQGEIPLATRAVLGQLELWLARRNPDNPMPGHPVPVLLDRIWHNE